jgi:DNA-binding MarR family transcriptional regulator
MRHGLPRVTELVREDRLARIPPPPVDPLIARLDHAILSIGALAARPRFHAESRRRAGLGGGYFPDHPARRVDPALYGVLAALDGAGMPGPMSIAVRLGLHPSTVSHHLERLECRGLIERHRYWQHRKWGDMRLTREGRDAYVTLRDARHEALADLLSQVPIDDREDLVQAVACLGDAVRRHNLDAHRRYLDGRREGRRVPIPGRSERPRPATREHPRRDGVHRRSDAPPRASGDEPPRRRRPVVTVRPSDDVLA